MHISFIISNFAVILFNFTDLFKIIEHQLIIIQIMQKTELLILFYLLQNKENAGKTLRQIATGAGVSLGSANNSMKKLAEQGFLIDNGKKKVLRKRQTLIDRWAAAYAESFRPKQFVGKFTFLTPGVREMWKEIALPANLAWSGEAAVALQYGTIIPVRWDIYTADTADALIATARMIPSPKGEIFVFKRFWHTVETPLIVIYADLLATGDDRCREIAEQLKPMI